MSALLRPTIHSLWLCGYSRVPWTRSRALRARWKFRSRETSKDTCGPLRRRTAEPARPAGATERTNPDGACPGCLNGRRCRYAARRQDGRCGSFSPFRQAGMVPLALHLLDASQHARLHVHRLHRMLAQAVARPVLRQLQSRNVVRPRLLRRHSAAAPAESRRVDLPNLAARAVESTSATNSLRSLALTKAAHYTRLSASVRLICSSSRGSSEAP